VRSGYWADCASTDFGALDPESTIAILPVAAIEQHGPHLPLSTDAVINAGIIRALLARTTAAPLRLVLPALEIGTSHEHGGFPGTLSVDASALGAVWGDVGRSGGRAGVRKLVIFNTHGGQKSLVDQVALRLRADLGMLVVRATYFAFGSPPGLFDAAELVNDIHGGEVETSLMLHLAPELVRKREIADFRGLPHELAARNELLGVEKPIGIGWLSQDLHPKGVVGNAARADAERGAAQLEYLVERFATLLAEVAATPLSILGSPSSGKGERSAQRKS
jgi:creatinine amidohydrolase